MQLRTVFDSNIYIAAALRPGQHADRWLDIAAMPNSGIGLFTSRPILAEVHRKLVDKFGFRSHEVDRFLQRVRVSATVVEPTLHLTVVPADPDDNRIIECAVSAKAHLIVTADTDLLALRQYEGIGITHPRELKNIFAADVTPNLFSPEWRG
ncbi:MAG: putative toxin-antitoxin system toxin component, PIN family [Mycobacteriales bacterium]